jgi:hypothetical protein
MRREVGRPAVGLYLDDPTGCGALRRSMYENFSDAFAGDGQNRTSVEGPREFTLGEHL